MSLLLAPYNNAMRLGQGFNSFTQQICIDDAVVADPERAENTVTNDGTTMRILAQTSGKPSAWTRQDEVVNDRRAETALVRLAIEDNEADYDVEEVGSNSQDITSSDEPSANSEEATTSAAKETPSVENEADVEMNDMNTKGNTGLIEKTKKPETRGTEEDKDADAETYNSIDNEPARSDSGSIEKIEYNEADDENHGSVEVTADDESKDTDETAEAPATPKTTEEEKSENLSDLDEAPKGTIHTTKTRVGARPSVGGKREVNAKQDATLKKQVKPTRPVTSENKIRSASGLAKVSKATELRRQRQGESQTKEVERKQPIEKEENGYPVKSPAVEKRVEKEKNGSKGTFNTGNISRAKELRKQRAEERQRKEEERREAREKEENERLAEQRAYQKQLEKEAREDERTLKAEAREEAKTIREEKRQYETQRREENRQAIRNAAQAKASALTLEDLDKIRAQNQFVERFNGMNDEEKNFSFDPTAPRGPSQTVVYTSRFVDRLSDVTDDMSISGSLSIKAAKVGGSGRGSFVDSDKFKESDLNFYISVKVINQTLNFKDALVYNPLRSVDQNNFQQVYGDSFISGFLEGGEFNALVSMKILNKAKKTDIKAEAKVAFTAGPMDITAEANVGIARSNIETNTETTIQVSWCGGGHIKPMEQQWDIKSLMAAAARFPDLVADCPQRTYAILTKYDSLRSFVARKPASYTPLQYENAQIYTNALMDSFMTYKSIYKRLGEQIFNVQGKILEIVPWTAENASKEAEDSTEPSTELTKVSKKNEATGLYPYVEDESRFDATVKGLSDARKVIRRQMMRIVNEVDLMEKDPKLATDEDHQEPFQSPVTFETRLPVTQTPEKFQRKADPLTGKRIMAKTQTEEEQKNALAAEEEAAEPKPLYVEGDDLGMDEKAAFDKLKEDNPGIGEHLRVTSAVGTTDKGIPYSNLDFLQPEWEVSAIKVEIARGAVSSIEVSYENGLILKKGKSVGGLVKELGSFLPGERITCASLEYGELPSQGTPPTPGGTCVLAIRLFTNHGRRLLGQAAINEVGENGTVTKDGFPYEKVKSIFVDAPLQRGTVKGFFGRCAESGDQGFTRLGLIWGDLYKAADPFASTNDASASSFDYNSQSDDKEIESLKDNLAEKEKALQNALNGKRPTTIAQGGITEPTQWNSGAPDFNNSHPVSFATPYITAPRMISGFNKLDQEAGRPIRIISKHRNVTPTGFEAVYDTFAGGISYPPRMSWLTLPENGVRFETGVYDTYGMPRFDNNQTTKYRTNFFPHFENTPTVVSWLYEVNMGLGWHSMTTQITHVDRERFDLHIGTWASRNFDGVRVGWLAFDDTGCTSRAKAGKINVVRSEALKRGRMTFEGARFSKTPTVFMALMELDHGDDRNIRFIGEATNVSTEGFDYACGTWAENGDHNMDHTTWIWVAVE